MNSTNHDPGTSTPDDENPQDRPTSDATTSDGLVDADTAEKFQQAVEHRLSEPSHEEPGTEEEQAADADPDEDNPVSVDNPE
ncbi:MULTISPECIES: hypothetical protein [Kocuria]|jgi:hypothetical protein|uniref:Uncharacterized protein n=1 Tax=Kocuria oceani TaxID=988827 RepID=A0ABV9TKL4_9MICC|nr:MULTISPECIES: hypothetical protein [Kocuria]WJZ68424.1 hypothetical protein QR564_17765 [Kocuria rosea]